MRTLAAVLGLLLVGCRSHGDGPPVAPTGTDPTDGIDTSTDTGDPVVTDSGSEPVFAQPTRLEVSCDPTANPLRFACHVTVEPVQPVQIRFSKADGTGTERVHTSDLLKSDDIGLYLMAPETAYTFAASAVGWPDDPVVSGTVTTGAPDETIRSSLAVTGVAGVPYVGSNSPCSSIAAAVIYDTATGELVWYQQLDSAGKLGLTDMVQFTEDHTVLGQTGQSVVEVDLNGNDLLRLARGTDYVEELHHDLFKRNGSYYLLYHDLGEPMLDAFLVLDPTGVEIARWRSADQLNVPPGAAGDWMHTNTLWVDPSGDIYLSSLTQSTVLKLNGDLGSPDFGRTIWAFAGNGAVDLGQDFTIDWSAVDGDDAFNGQHDAHLRTDGRLTLLDNQNGRALVLSLDETALTATVDEAWPTIEASCGPQGTAADTPSGDPIVACSGRSVVEYDAVLGIERWRADAVCPAPTGPPPLVLEGAVRWYPLAGW